MNNKILGSKIKELREKNGYSQEQLAKILGYKSRSTINKIELGINTIPLPKLEALAKALKTDISEFMVGDNKELKELFSLISNFTDEQIKILTDFARQLNNKK